MAKGVKPASNDNPIKVQRAIVKKDDSSLVAEEMAEGDEHTQEVADKVDDAEFQQKKDKQKKNDEFNRVSDDMKTQAAADVLGAELVQVQAELGIKANLMKNIQKVNLNLAQISSKDNGSVFRSSGEED